MHAHMGHFINAFEFGSPNETGFVYEVTLLTLEGKFTLTVRPILINNIYTAACYEM